MSALDALLPVAEAAERQSARRPRTRRAERLMRERGERVTSSSDEGDEVTVTISRMRCAHSAGEGLRRNSTPRTPSRRTTLRCPDLAARNLEKRARAETKRGGQ